MITIESSADMARALASQIDAELKALLALLRARLLEHEGYDLGELARVIVVEPGDALAGIEAGAGYPLASGEPPPFEYVQRHGAWIEAVLILSDDGFGIVLFVPDRPGVDPALVAALRRHA